MSIQPPTTITARLLNCAKNHATTVSTIQHAANDTTVFALLLQEPWCTKDGLPPDHPDFYIHYPTNKEPKCITYIRRHKDITARLSFSHGTSFLGTSFTIAERSFTLYNFYSPPRTPALSELLSTFQPADSSIIMDDLNTHHPWWMGSDATNTNTIRASTDSNKLADWLEHHHYYLLNTPGRPTHFPRNGQNPSTNDLGLVRGPIGASVLFWALNDNSTSDHSICNLTLQSTILIAPTLRRDWHAADWDLFETTILKAGLDFSSLNSSQEIDRAATALTSTITTAINIAIPMRSRKRKNAPWWTSNLDYTRTCLIQAERRYRQHRNEEASTACIELRQK
jgi:hypothetical protein